MYFVTICTKHRECYFGDVVNDKTRGGAMNGVKTPNLLETPESVETPKLIETPKLGVSTAADPSSPANPDHTNTTKMQLSEIGLLAQKYWLEIPIHFPFVVLDEFVVMPDHVHGIMVIDKTRGDTRPTIPPSAIPRRTAHASQKWHPGTLGVIINQYKRMVTIRARKIHADFGWQSRFHDHIIRNDASLQ
jgi:REP element-mobilizing transposase RayT